MNIICDIDGTLAHMDDRRTFFEWDKVKDDRFDPFVGYALSLHADAGDTILIVSGREDVCYHDTRWWLWVMGIKYNELIMRRKGDFRPDEIVKAEMLTYIRTQYPNLTTQNTIVYDDRVKVVKMWRSLGFKVFQVAPGDFDKPKPISLSDATLVWNDPSPIEGNDYTIRSIRQSDIDSDMYQIAYGPEDSEPSEAEVFAHEIGIILSKA